MHRLHALHHQLDTTSIGSSGISARGSSLQMAPVVGESLGASPSAGPVSMTIPLDTSSAQAVAHGSKRWGHLEVPDPSIMASSLVPICVINGPKVAGGEDAKTVLLLAGNHGNEYEGQVVLRQLAESVAAEAIRGRLIILPTISMEAAGQWSREWPVGAAANTAGTLACVL